MGTRAEHVAVAPSFDPVGTKLSPEETTVLMAIGRVRQISDLISHVELDENRAIAALLSLRAKGVVVKARVQARPKEPEINTAMLEQVDLEDVRKFQILEIESKLENTNLFELMGVPPGSDAATVKAAFFELSRRIHPDRYFGKNLGSFKARMEKIFTTLSDAHQTLTDPVKREAYLAAHPSLPKSVPKPQTEAQPSAPVVDALAPDPKRDDERRGRLKKHPYLARHSRVAELMQRARAAMAKGDFAAAHIDLVTASNADDRNPELKSLIVEAKKKADAQRSVAEYEKGSKLEQAGDIQGAMASYRSASNGDVGNALAAFSVARLMFRFNLDSREAISFGSRAVEADPRHVDAHVLLGKLYDLAEMKQLSKRHYEQALRLAPDNLEAKKAVKGRWPF